MASEHHHQRIDMENGYLEATRDDTDELQDLHFAAYLKDGYKTREAHAIYNIQYDYIRYQEWKNGLMIEDSIYPDIGYGHLQWEYSQLTPPNDWINPYPENYEPVKPKGCDMFRSQGTGRVMHLLEHHVIINLMFYVYDDLDESVKSHANLITDVSIRDEPDDQSLWEIIEKRDKKRMQYFDPLQALKHRIRTIRRQSRIIGVDIPIDPRFID